MTGWEWAADHQAFCFLHKETEYLIHRSMPSLSWEYPGLRSKMRTSNLGLSQSKNIMAVSQFSINTVQPSTVQALYPQKTMKVPFIELQMCSNQCNRDSKRIP